MTERVARLVENAVMLYLMFASCWALAHIVSGALNLLGVGG